MLSSTKKNKLEQALNLLDSYMEERLSPESTFRLTDKQGAELVSLCDFLFDNVVPLYETISPFPRIVAGLREKVELGKIAPELRYQQVQDNKSDMFKQVLLEADPYAPEVFVEEDKLKQDFISSPESRSTREIIYSFLMGLSTGVAVTLCAAIWFNNMPLQERPSLRVAQEIVQDENIDKILGVVKQTTKTIFDTKTSDLLKSDYNLSNYALEKVPAFDQEALQNFNLINSQQSEPEITPEVEINQVPTVAEEKVAEGIVEKPAFLYDKNLDNFLDKEFKTLNEDALNGVVEAQYALGMIYLKVQPNEEKKAWEPKKEAVFWLGEAATKGSFLAQYNMGVLHQKEIIERSSPEQAILWYERSAKQGYGRALFNLGIAYLNGFGVEVDHKVALTHLKKSYDKGVEQSAYVLGKLYENGVHNFGHTNKEQAIFWYNKAVTFGDKRAQRALNNLEKQENAFSKKTTTQGG